MMYLRLLGTNMLVKKFIVISYSKFNEDHVCLEHITLIFMIFYTKLNNTYSLLIKQARSHHQQPYKITQFADFQLKHFHLFKHSQPILIGIFSCYNHPPTLKYTKVQVKDTWIPRNIKNVSSNCIKVSQ